MRPHKRQPTRLPCPWDSPGKNTGVGCHFLLQSMKMKSESEVAQSCPTLRDPMDCSLPGSSAHGIFQARVLDPSGPQFSLGYAQHPRGHLAEALANSQAASAPWPAHRSRNPPYLRPGDHRLQRPQPSTARPRNGRLATAVGKLPAGKAWTGA